MFLKQSFSDSKLDLQAILSVLAVQSFTVFLSDCTKFCSVS